MIVSENLNNQGHFFEDTQEEYYIQKCEKNAKIDKKFIL